MNELVLVLTAALLVFTPGLVVLSAGRVAGWWLAMAPLITYVIVVCAVTVDELCGWRFGWNATVLAVATCLFAGGAALASRVPLPANPRMASCRSQDSASTTREAATFRQNLRQLPARLVERINHNVVPVTAIVLAAALALATLLRAMRRLSSPHQDFDTAFHLSVIDITHDYESTNPVNLVNDVGIGEAVLYYPLGWHALAAVLQGITGADTVSVMNASMIVPALPAIVGITALVRMLSGSRWLAGLAACGVACGIGFPFDVIRHGPLSGFLCGIALIPAVLLSVLCIVRGPQKSGSVSVFALGGGLGACVYVHPGAAALALMCVVPFAVHVMCQDRFASWKRALVAVPIAALFTAILSALPAVHTREQMKSIKGLMNWPEYDSRVGALINLMCGQTFSDYRQYHIAAATAVGVVAALWWWRQWLWLVVASSAVGGLYIVAAAVPGQKAAELTAWWWNDARRLLSCFAILQSIFIALGVYVVVSAVLRLVLSATSKTQPHKTQPHETTLDKQPVIAATIVVALLAPAFAVTFLAASGQTEGHYKFESRLSAEELTAWHEVAEQLGPDAVVLNDPDDGSAYARSLVGLNLYGQRNIGTISYASPPTLTQQQFDDEHRLLWRHFRELATSAEVRRYVRQAKITHVVLGSAYSPMLTRPIGLMGLSESRYLKRLPNVGPLQVWEVTLPDDED